jgi:hypothetical protein
MPGDDGLDHTFMQHAGHAVLTALREHFTDTGIDGRPDLKRAAIVMVFDMPDGEAVVSVGAGYRDENTLTRDLKLIATEPTMRRPPMARRTPRPRS